MRRTEVEDEDRPLELVDALEDQLTTYDETLYYVAKDYVATHALYNKQHKRAVDVDAFPLRYQLLQVWKQPLSSRVGIVYFIVQCFLVLASIVQLMYESAPQYSTDVNPNFRTLWLSIELPIAAIFTLDLIVHFCLLPPEPNDFSRSSRRSFFKKSETWLDILTIMPSILALFEDYTDVAQSFDFLKAIRILRFTRVVRQFHSIDQLAHTIEKSFEPLIGPFIFITGVAFTLSSAIYFTEKGEYDAVSGQFLIEDCDCEMSAPRALDPSYPCPKVPSRFLSIPHTIWFTVVTITTVGYGDLYPRCPYGRAIVALAAFMGNVLTAMPIAIVGAYYTNIVMANRQRQKGESEKRLNYKPLNRDVRNIGGSDEQQALMMEGSVGGRSAAALAKVVGSQSEGRGGAEGDFGDEGATTVAGDAMTVGEKIAAVMASSDVVFDALKPPGSVVHRLNALIKREFDAVVEQLSTKQGQQRMREACLRAAAPIALEQVRAPPTALLPRSVSLTQPLRFVFGVKTPSVVASTCDLWCSKDPERSSGLPAQLFTLAFCPTRQHVTITPIFPAHICVNDKDLDYGVAVKLLIGDIITIQRDPLCGEPISYQFTRSHEISSSLKHARNDDEKVVRTLPPVDGSPVVEIRPIAEQREYRNLTLSAYIPTNQSMGSGPTSGLAVDPFDMSDL